MLKRFFKCVFFNKRTEDIPVKAKSRSYLMRQVRNRLIGIEDTYKKQTDISLWYNTTDSPYAIYLNYFNRFGDDVVFNEFKKLLRDSGENTCIKPKANRRIRSYYIDPYPISCPHCKRLETRERFIKLMTNEPFNAFLKFSTFGNTSKQKLIEELAYLEDATIVKKTPVDIEAFMDLIDDVVVVEHKGQVERGLE